MLEKKVIEFVCTANHGRSPVAELVALQYLRDLGADNEYTAASSGNAVDAIRTGDVPLSIKLDIIYGALGREDVCTQLGFKPKEVEKAITDGDKTAIGDYFKQAQKFFWQEEHDHRAEAVEYFGLPGKLKEHSDQTIALPDRVAIYGMTESNKNGIVKIYEPSEFNPLIDVLKKEGVPDAFMKGKDVYLKAVEAIMDAVPNRIDESIEMYKHS